MKEEEKIILIACANKLLDELEYQMMWMFHNHKET